MSLIFLESKLSLDISDLNIGTGSNNSIEFYLTRDKRSTTDPVTLSVTVSDANSVDVTGQHFNVAASVLGASPNYVNKRYKLTLSFPYPFANVKFGQLYKLHIVAPGGDYHDLFVELNYANKFVSTAWGNADEISSLVDDIDLKASLSSKPVNNRLRSLLQGIITSLNQAKQLYTLYRYKDKYLDDIINFAINTGNLYEPSVTSLTTDSNNNIATVITTYGAGRSTTIKLKLTYTYSNKNLDRLKGSNNTIVLETKQVSTLDTIKIEVLSDADAVIYQLGEVSISRELKTYSISNVAAYDANKAPTDYENLLSDFRTYRTYVMTGWTVRV